MWDEPYKNSYGVNIPRISCFDYRNNNISFKEPTYDEGFSNEEIESHKFIRELLKNEEIARPEHVDYYMNSKNILELALKHYRI